MRAALILLTVLLGRTALDAGQAAPARTIGGLRAEAGARVSGFLDVPAAADEGTRIPFTVINGARPGPLLALIAGIHGAEYSPILAMQSFASRLDERALAGAVMIVHVASPEAFFARSVYVNPVDRKNVNRSFPGRKEGTHSERTAYVLTEQIIRPADVVVDVHSGDANESLTPWVGYYAQHGAPAAIARSRELAMAFGAPFVVAFPGAYAPADAVYTGATAAALGKPTFDVEIGERGVIDLSAARQIQDGLLRVMHRLAMIADAPPAPGPSRLVERRTSVAAEGDGLFYPAVSAGARVRKGDVLGRATDIFGSNERTIAAPADGVVLVVLAAPPVRKGETIAVIANVP